MSKGFAPILIVLFIALAVGGYLLYQKQARPIVPQQIVQSTPVPTLNPESTNSAKTANPDLIGANWNTYTSTKYGYSIKYPTDWKLGMTVLTQNSISETEANNYPQRVDLRNITGDQNFSTISIDPEGYGSCINPAMKASNSELNDLKATSNFFTNNIGHEVYCYTNFELKNLPKLSVGVSYPKNDAELVNQILSTFRFD